MMNLQLMEFPPVSHMYWAKQQMFLLVPDDTVHLSHTKYHRRLRWRQWYDAYTRTGQVGIPTSVRITLCSGKWRPTQGKTPLRRERCRVWYTYYITCGTQGRSPMSWDGQYWS